MSGIISFLSINGQEITEQGRKVSDSYNFGASDVELDSGINKRYIKKNKRIFSFQWEWMPTLQEKTIDNRKARDYVKQIAFSRNKAQMTIQLHPSDPSESFDVYVNDYSENLIRRSPQEGCDYYSVSLTVEEV
jgi:hypothetical protein